MNDKLREAEISADIKAIDRNMPQMTTRRNEAQEAVDEAITRKVALMEELIEVRTRMLKGEAK